MVTVGSTMAAVQKSVIVRLIINALAPANTPATAETIPSVTQRLFTVCPIAPQFEFYQRI